MHEITQPLWPILSVPEPKVVDILFEANWTVTRDAWEGIMESPHRVLGRKLLGDRLYVIPGVVLHRPWGLYMREETPPMHLRFADWNMGASSAYPSAAVVVLAEALAERDFEVRFPSLCEALSCAAAKIIASGIARPAFTKMGWSRELDFHMRGS